MAFTEEFYKNVVEISEKNEMEKESVRLMHFQQKEEEFRKRDCAMNEAVKELAEKLIENGLKEMLLHKAEDGYFEHLLFAVSLDKSMDEFCTHEHGNPYYDIVYDGKKYKFSYRSLFWNSSWKTYFAPFSLNYKWNKPQTLLSVYIDWGEFSQK